MSPVPTGPGARPLLETEVSVPEALCRVLEEAGVEFVLGIPGGDVMSIFDALRDHSSTIRTVLVRDERVAGVMAEAYGRTTGRPAVVLAQGAWVLANATGGMLEALTGASPVLVMAEVSDKIPWSHQNPTQSGTGESGNWDARRALGGVAKVLVDVHHPAQAIAQTQLALKQATTGSPGPAVVLYYRASLVGTVGPDTKPVLYHSGGYLHSHEPPAPPDRVAAAAKLLAEARRPVVLAGNGVRVARAQGSLLALAEHLGCPVVTTGAGKGVFSEAHPLAGGVIGDYGLTAASELLGASDVVLAVGTRLAPGDTCNQHPEILDPVRQRVVQVDIDPLRAGWSMPVDVAVVGHARVVLDQLRAAVPEGDAGAGHQRVAEAFAVHGTFDSEESLSDCSPVLPQRVIHALGADLPPETTVTADAGENRIFMVHHYRSRAGDFLQPGATGSMGYAIPAALGVKLAEPDRPVVAVLGDGGFALSVGGLMTALEASLPIVAVVLNNSSLGWVRHVQGQRSIASDLGTYDHAAVATSLGLLGIRVERAEDLAPAFDRALAAGIPAVIDVVTSDAQTWEQVTSPRSAMARALGSRVGKST